jgi:hypothetical protein
MSYRPTHHPLAYSSVSLLYCFDYKEEGAFVLVYSTCFSCYSKIKHSVNDTFIFSALKIENVESEFKCTKSRKTHTNCEGFSLGGSQQSMHNP